MRESKLPKMTFRTCYGHYEFLVISYGLMNAPTVFMGLMNRVFEGYVAKPVIVFIEDILVYLRTVEEHELHLKIVLGKLREKRLYAKFSICKFSSKRLHFWRHVVSKDGISMDSSKIETVSQWEQPRNLIEVQSFLGLAWYYQRFINGFLKFAAPMMAFTCKNMKFEGTKSCE